MALTDETMNSMVMPVAPMYGGNYGNNGMFGGDIFAWFILLILLCGNRGFGGFGGNDGNNIYPWMNQADTVNNGFQNLSTQNALTGIQNGVQGLATQLCNSFANVETAANARQMANMQSMNQISSQFADCCCENRLASANLQNVIQTENCADRAAISDGIRDILANQNAGIQRILDQMCNDKIDSKNEEIANLRTQLNMANLAASQGAQTAQLIADNNAQTAQLVQRIAPYPVPSWNVPNPYAYMTNSYGCGCNA